MLSMDSEKSAFLTFLLCEMTPWHHDLHERTCTALSDRAVSSACVIGGDVVAGSQILLNQP